MFGIGVPEMLAILVVLLVSRLGSAGSQSGSKVYS